MSSSFSVIPVLVTSALLSGFATVGPNNGWLAIGAAVRMAEGASMMSPYRTSFRRDAGGLGTVADGPSAPIWVLLGKRGVAVPTLAQVRLCGTGAWRDQYRRKVARASHVYGIRERLDNVEFGSCDLAVFTRQELAELGERANGYDRYLLDDDAIHPHP